MSVLAVEDLGNYRMVTVALGDHELKVKIPEEKATPVDSGYLVFKPEFTKLYSDSRLVA